MGPDREGFLRSGGCAPRADDGTVGRPRSEGLGAGNARQGPAAAAEVDPGRGSAAADRAGSVRRILSRLELR